MCVYARACDTDHLQPAQQVLSRSESKSWVAPGEEENKKREGERASLTIYGQFSRFRLGWLQILWRGVALVMVLVGAAVLARPRT